MGAANQFGGLATGALAQQQQLYAPAISYDTNLVNSANSGDYSKLISSAGPALGTISSQFDQAKNNILNNTPAGPGQSAALAQLPSQQAGATASTLNQSYQGALSQLAGLGTNEGQTGLQLAGADLSGLSGAATTFGNVAQQKAQAKASIDSLIGSIAGGAGAAIGCWVAEAIYGTDDVRTHIVRGWLNGPFRQTIFGSLVMRFYLRHGVFIAGLVRRFSLLGALLKPLFDLALAKASAK